MSKIKKLFVFMVCGIMAAGCLMGCSTSKGSGDADETTSQTSDNIDWNVDTLDKLAGNYVNRDGDNIEVSSDGTFTLYTEDSYAYSGTCEYRESESCFVFILNDTNQYVNGAADNETITMYGLLGDDSDESTETELFVKSESGSVDDWNSYAWEANKDFYESYDYSELNGDWDALGQHNTWTYTISDASADGFTCIKKDKNTGEGVMIGDSYDGSMEDRKEYQFTDVDIKAFYDRTGWLESYNVYGYNDELGIYINISPEYGNVNEEY